MEVVREGKGPEQVATYGPSSRNTLPPEMEEPNPAERLITKGRLSSVL